MSIYGGHSRSKTPTKDVAGNSLFRGDIELVRKTVDPTTADINYHMSTIWINESTDEAFLLVELENNVATWVSITSDSSVLTTKGDLLTHNGTSDVRLPVGTDGQILVADSSTTEGIAWKDGVTGGETSYFDAYDSSGGLDITSGFTDIPWDAERRKDAIYTHSTSTDPDEITVTVTDTYFVIARVSTDISSGSSNSVTEIRLMRDSGGGFTEETGVRGYCYNNTSSDGEGTAVIQAVLSLTENEKIKIQAQRLVGTSTVVTKANASSITILRIGNEDGSDFVSELGTVFTLIDLDYTQISFDLQRSLLVTVVNLIENGASALFSISKTDSDNNATIFRLVSVPAISSGEQLELKWVTETGPEIRKTGASHDGDYAVNVIDDTSVKYSVTLTGTGTSTLHTATSGTFFFTIIGAEDAPHAIFAISKNESTEEASIFRLNSAPGLTGSEELSITWAAGSGILLSKNGANHDGSYTARSLFNDALTQSNVTLSGTAYTNLTTVQQRKTTIISIKNNITDGPSAIFAISKNMKTNTSSIFRLVSSPGTTSGEELELRWNASSALEIRKNGSSHDGVYSFKILN